MAPTVKKSKTWEYFKDIGENKAKCTICMKSLSFKGAGIYNLTRHLKSFHPLLLAGILGEHSSTISLPIPKTLTAPSTSQDTMAPPSASPEAIVDGSTLTQPAQAMPTSALQRQKTNQINAYFPKPISIKKSESINKLLLEMIVKNYLPFTLVESDAFKAFTHELCSSYSAPTRKTISNGLLQKYYNIVKENLEKVLAQAEYIALTTDSWTSASHEQYVAVTAHFLDDETSIQSYMLECIPDVQRHTAQNLANLVKQVCEDWKIEEKIVAVTADNAANIQNAINLLKWRSVPCFAHTLNLIVQSALRDIKDTQTKVKSIVELFRRSVLASERLKATQKQLGEKELKVKQDIITRWNSTVDMFERILEIKKSVITTIATEYPNTPNLTPQDIKILTESCNVLRNFKSVTEIMSSEKHVTISQIIVLANLLIKKCNEAILKEDMPQVVIDMALRLSTDLSSRFRNVEDNKLFAVSTLLDPRFKTYGFPESKKSSVDSAKKSLLNLAASHRLTEGTATAIEDEYEQQKDQTESPSIWDEFDTKVKDAVKKQNPTAASIIEVDKYLDEPLISRKLNNPLIWWNSKKLMYPRLYNIVKRHFCIPATSTPSERVFSKAGHVISDRRNRLQGKKVRMILFLHANM